MQDFWNKRYAEPAYAYGTDPNQFFKSQLDLLKPGRLFLPAEGEGRNAVYAILQGWEVIACDQSEEGMRKAEQLAARYGASIDYRVAEFGEMILAPNYFDCVALIYAHFPADKRRLYHKKAVNTLEPGGTLILEGFSKEQTGKPSGGPQNPDMLFSEAELRAEFAGLSFLKITSEEVELAEGEFHRGLASVVRLVGVK